VHAHHGWHPDADAWQAHCARAAARLGVPFDALRLALPHRPGESREAVARQARYAAFDRRLPPGAMLLTAHQRDDQAETVLLQLLRGAGPEGLAGIAPLKSRGDGWTGRPLLELDRAMLRRDAERRGLSWIDDPSNADTDFDRNYLRAEILPRLRARWPGCTATLARSAAHCAAAASITRERGASLLDEAPAAGAWRLDKDYLLGLTAPDRAVLLRTWLGACGLPSPDAGRLERIWGEVAAARPDGSPRVAWPGGEVRRYRGFLYAMPPLRDPVAPWVSAWDGSEPLELPAGLGRLRLDEAGVALPRAAWESANPEVRIGSVPDPAAPAGRTGRRSYKRLCQDWGVPPWVRARIPLLYLEGRLAAFGDYGACEPWRVTAGEPAVHVAWERPGYLR